eukprot:365035-Chlamydomonas_euryale.AAC.4
MVKMAAMACRGYCKGTVHWEATTAGESGGPPALCTPVREILPALPENLAAGVPSAGVDPSTLHARRRRTPSPPQAKASGSPQRLRSIPQPARGVQNLANHQKQCQAVAEDECLCAQRASASKVTRRAGLPACQSCMRAHHACGLDSLSETAPAHLPAAAHPSSSHLRPIRPLHTCRRPF